MSHFRGTLSTFNCVVLAHHGLAQAGIDIFAIKK